MIVLDTSVLSETFRPQPDPHVVAWLESLAGEQAGLPISTADAQIAAICRVLGATCATRNSTDFELTGVELIDPWVAGAPSA